MSTDKNVKTAQPQQPRRPPRQTRETLSRERVRQIETSALRKLRVELLKRGLYQEDLL